MCNCMQELQSGNTMLSMGHVVTTSVGMCDIDIRPVIYLLGDFLLIAKLFKLAFKQSVLGFLSFSRTRTAHL